MKLELARPSGAHGRGWDGPMGLSCREAIGVGPWSPGTRNRWLLLYSCSHMVLVHTSVPTARFYRSPEQVNGFSEGQGGSTVIPSPSWCMFNRTHSTRPKWHARSRSAGLRSVTTKVSRFHGYSVNCIVPIVRLCLKECQVFTDT